MRILLVWLKESVVALAMALCMLPLLPVAPLPVFQLFVRSRFDATTRKRYAMRLHGPRRPAIR